MIDQPLSDRRPAGGLRHFCVQRGFIDKDQTFQDLAHERLAPGGPDLPPKCDIRAMLLAGEQGFFYG